MVLISERHDWGKQPTTQESWERSWTGQKAEILVLPEEVAPAQMALPYS